MLAVDRTIAREEDVPAFTLPDALELDGGGRVTTAQAWRQRRRQELLAAFASQVYGRAPVERPVVEVESFGTAEALEGLAWRRQARLHLATDIGRAGFDVLIYLPRRRSTPAPAFVGLNFNGNHTVTADPQVRPSPGLEDRPRGSSSGRWPIERIVSGGYALVTAARHEIAPDDPARFREGVLSLFGPADDRPPGDEEMGAIGAWAWALSRVLDYLESDESAGDIDATRAIAIGHSRLGKAALWAGAQDDRFAAVVSNNSGCGGAALSRRRFGETVEAINSRFPHWFCGRFKQFNGREEALAVDQHELLALIAPRPLYVASATEDLWADPRGEFLSLRHASPVYELLGVPSLAAADMPPPDTPIAGRLAYHLRTGPHDLTRYDWEQYLGFADRQIAPS